MGGCRKVFSLGSSSAGRDGFTLCDGNGWEADVRPKPILELQSAFIQRTEILHDTMGGSMRRLRERLTLFVRAVLLSAASMISAGAVACNPPETAPTGDQFYMCFDPPPRLGPQPILDADRGPFLVIEAELNGHKLPALLDTGAEASMVDAATANELGLVAGGSYEITALDGRKTQGQLAPIDRLVIGGLTRFGGLVIVGDLSAAKSVAGQRFAIIIGADILSQVALAVDRDSQSVVVLPNNANVSGSDWSAPLRVQPGRNIFATELTLNGNPVTVRLDTGADHEVILRDSKWGQFVPPTTAVTTLAAAGAAGLFVQPMARLDDVKIGGQSVGDVIAIKVADAGIPDGMDGLLGIGILSRFNLFLNPTAGIMVISPPQKPAPPRRETMVGIQGPPTDDGITILHVMAGSPAETAGLRPGDRICTIDGEKVSSAWESTPKNDWMTGPKGKTVVLGRCGGETLRLTLRRFY